MVAKRQHDLLHSPIEEQEFIFVTELFHDIAILEEHSQDYVHDGNGKVNDSNGKVNDSNCKVKDDIKSEIELVDLSALEEAAAARNKGGETSSHSASGKK